MGPRVPVASRTLSRSGRPYSGGDEGGDFAYIWKQTTLLRKVNPAGSGKIYVQTSILFFFLRYEVAPRSDSEESGSEEEEEVRVISGCQGPQCCV